MKRSSKRRVTHRKRTQQGVVLLNIVVAVLFDEFINTVVKERAEAKRISDLKNRTHVRTEASQYCLCSYF